VNFTKKKIETSSRVYKDGINSTGFSKFFIGQGGEIMISGMKDTDQIVPEMNDEDSNYLFSVCSEGEKSGNTFL
jgi:hypothetical protein